MLLLTVRDIFSGVKKIRPDILITLKWPLLTNLNVLYWLNKVKYKLEDLHAPTQIKMIKHFNYTIFLSDKKSLKTILTSNVVVFANLPKYCQHIVWTTKKFYLTYKKESSDAH